MTDFPPGVWALIQTTKHEIECAPFREHRERFAPTLKLIATADCEWVPNICYVREDASLCGEVVGYHFSAEPYIHRPGSSGTKFRNFTRTFSFIGNEGRR
jgi:hypothetical protein